MKLKAFLESLPRGGRAAFATKIGIQPVYLAQLAAELNERVPSPELCVLIERASDTQVMRWDLRPKDWFRIWPEIEQQKGAPDVPAPVGEGV